MLKLSSVDEILPFFINKKELSLKYSIFSPLIIMPSFFIIAVASLATVKFWSFENSISLACKSISWEKDLFTKKVDL